VGGFKLGISFFSEEHWLRVSGSRVLRKIFRPKWYEVVGSWIKFHNEEIHNLYSTNIMASNQGE
jgi:hypothetical protein